MSAQMCCWRRLRSAANLKFCHCLGIYSRRALSAVLPGAPGSFLCGLFSLSAWRKLAFSVDMCIFVSVLVALFLGVSVLGFFFLAGILLLALGAGS